MRLHASARVRGVDRLLIGKIARSDVHSERKDAVRFGQSIDDDDGYLAVLATDIAERRSAPRADGVRDLDYLDDGDVVAIDPNGFVRVLYRKKSPHNFILMTEQCNSYCLMCSQPPKRIDDSDRITSHLRLVDLIDPSTPELGITGGEPTLFRDDFLHLVAHCSDRLPHTALHVLTNGRLFYYRRFAERLGAIAHSDLMLGIPLYSDLDSDHDYIVQARGAFEETVLGLQHLAQFGVAVEIRVVLHRQTVPRLVRLAEFIARNLPFASHVALMGLEMFGFVHKNVGELWIDPHDYQEQLRDAVLLLHTSGLNVSIYNHQLCVLREDLWPFARKSISDWKNVYLPLCDGCRVMERCGGFFESAVKRHSAHLGAIDLTEPSAELKSTSGSDRRSRH
jgi:His-Xaa-Ser system radical SAM maturase HxsC